MVKDAGFRETEVKATFGYWSIITPGQAAIAFGLED